MKKNKIHVFSEEEAKAFSNVREIFGEKIEIDCSKLICTQETIDNICEYLGIKKVKNWQEFWKEAIGTWYLGISGNVIEFESPTMRCNEIVARLEKDKYPGDVIKVVRDYLS